MEDADSAAEAAQGALLHSGGLAQDFFAAMGGDSCAAERADVREALGPSPPLAKRSRGWRGTRLDDWEPMEDEHEPVEALAKAEADTEDEYQPFGEYQFEDECEEALEEEPSQEEEKGARPSAKEEAKTEVTWPTKRQRPITPPRRPRFQVARPKPSATRGRRCHVSEEELKELRVEQLATETLGVKWQARGPAGPQNQRTKETWRGQKWRPGTERFCKCFSFLG